MSFHHNMLYTIKRIASLICRIPRSRGFGVQSPSASRFIRYVLNERYPYYAYEELCQRFPQLDEGQRRWCELLFRLANYAQAEVWWELSPCSDAEKAYITAGCHKTQLTTNCPHPGVIRMQADGQATENYKLCVERASATTLLVVGGIHRNRRAFRLWRKMTTDSRTSVSFDLFDCGILFFDNRTKQHYKVNY